MAKRKELDDENEDEVNDYGDIIDMAWDDLPEDKLLPTGTWLLGGRNAAYVKGQQGKNSKVLFFYVAKEPNKGIDPTEYELFIEDYDMNESQVVYTIWIEFNRDWRKVQRHLAIHGITDTTMSLKKSLKAFRGTEVMAHVEPRTYDVTRNGVVESVTENSATNFSPVETV